ncbi:MAG: phospholipase D family protein [Bacteroidota bacterium]
MAKFINTRKAVSEIEELIKNAGETLTLISPYLKLSSDFKELISYRNSKDKITTIIFRHQDLNPDEVEYLQSLRFTILKYNETLHAKCYVSDTKMIITSLNLYEFSMANNKEMGVLINKNDETDSQLFQDAMREVDFINETSRKFESTQQQHFQSAQKYHEHGNTNNMTGYCIRTGIEIPFNPEKPLSYEAFKIWNEYGDPEYPENFCHFSGQESSGDTSVSRPILKKYWRKAKQIHNF